VFAVTRSSPLPSLGRISTTSAACAPARYRLEREEIFQEGIIMPPVLIARDGISRTQLKLAAL
jgi:hypothetical protein